MRFSHFRGVLAVVVGGALFLVCGFLASAVSVLSLRLAQPIINHAPKWAGKLLVAVVYRLILGMKIVREGEKIPHDGRPTIIIGNHPVLLLIMIFVAYVQDITGTPFMIVAKWEHLYKPWLGWPLWFARLGIFIKRAQRADALAVLRRQWAAALRRAMGLLIFVDQSRPTAEKIADDHKKYRDGVPNIEDFQFTLLPRKGGIGQLLDEAPSNVRVIDITSECSVPATRWQDVYRLAGSAFLIHVEDVTHQIPRDPTAREAWLVERWRWKNAVKIPDFRARYAA